MSHSTYLLMIILLRKKKRYPPKKQKKQQQTNPKTSKRQQHGNLFLHQPYISQALYTTRPCFFQIKTECP